MSTLPFLPGYRIDPTPHSKKSFHKTQTFSMNNGIRVDKANNPSSASVNAQMAMSSQISLKDAYVKPEDTFQTTVDEQRMKAAHDTTVPSWVSLDRQVLRFYCYFKEEVNSSADEEWRIRKCILFFYLENGSIHIAEPKIENSGVPQGTFLSRHCPMKQDGTYLDLNDLAVGGTLELYGRTYYFVDADQFTRDFFISQRGVELAPAQAYPVDAFELKKKAKRTDFNKRMNPLKEFMEASLGKPRGLTIEATQQFLQNDGKVLRFYCVWDDKKMYGEKRPYIMHFFLADDTVEVLEVHQNNSGRDLFPQLLKRNRLPKDYLQSIPTVATIGMKVNENLEYYEVQDFKVGSEVIVFGRHLLICGCDDFTREFFMQNYGFTDADFPEVKVEDEAEPVPTIYPPEYNGFGSEEDSLGSFLYLMPKVPKKNFKKIVDLDGVTLRYLSKFTNPRPEDKNRRFVITYYMGDDTISVFEKFQRNSGFVGGKFLERRRVKNPDSGEYFCGNDFFVDATLNINNFIFTLLEADASTQKYLQTVGREQ